MKKLKPYGLFVIVFLLASCGKSPQEKLIGEWIAREKLQVSQWGQTLKMSVITVYKFDKD